ncbi:MAG: hypothetical protein J7M21_04225 [Planctomycetes bacterium]|nr:hypothetical protein [Planctomycetota bacterium]
MPRNLLGKVSKRDRGWIVEAWHRVRDAPTLEEARRLLAGLVEALEGRHPKVASWLEAAVPADGSGGGGGAADTGVGHGVGGVGGRRASGPGWPAPASVPSASAAHPAEARSCYFTERCGLGSGPLDSCVENGSYLFCSFFFSYFLSSLFLPTMITPPPLGVPFE